MEQIITATFLVTTLLAFLLMLQPLWRDIKHGMSYTLSSFDERKDEGVIGRRLEMVTRNQVEALALWLPLVFIAQVNSLSHPHLAWIATGFVGARVSYALVSLAGIPVLRSLTWMVGLGATAYFAWLVWHSS